MDDIPVGLDVSKNSMQLERYMKLTHGYEIENLDGLSYSPEAVRLILSSLEAARWCVCNSWANNKTKWQRTDEIELGYMYVDGKIAKTGGNQLRRWGAVAVGL